MRTFVVFLFLLLISTPLAAQRKSVKPKFDAKKNAEEQKELAAKAKLRRDELIDATKTYQESLRKLLDSYEVNQQHRKQDIERKRKMIEQGLIAKRELEPLEADLQEIIGKISETNNKILQADQLIVEIANLELQEQEMAKRKPIAPGVYFDNLRYIRYSGATSWSIRDYGKVENFFQASFRRGLPVSAFGQSETHNRLGFDHSNSFDVALHPDSVEAQTLMRYLRSQGIPFTAFRGAIPGNATGAHIHIGFPSHRFR